MSLEVRLDGFLPFIAKAVGRHVSAGPTGSPRWLHRLPQDFAEGRGLRAGDNHLVQEPKTKGGRRTVPLLPEVVEELKALRRGGLKKSSI